MTISAAFAAAFASAAHSSILDEVCDADEAADMAVASIRTPQALESRQCVWRKYWLDALGGMPERTPLNARVTGTVECDGFRLENIVFESQPGVLVTAHLAIPTGTTGVSPVASASGHTGTTGVPPVVALHRPPVVLMPLGHSNGGILNPRYAAHLAMTARAGFAAFAWDPISQGERRQAVDAKYDYTDNCSTEHCRLGARAWLVGWNFARFRIWDAVRAVDYVESRPDLDTSKLGVMGTSGGGTMSAYLQAFDPRIKVAFPNCYVSSLREVVRERGCHDAEQFFWNMLPSGFNHAALLAMGQPRVALATGSRWKDYFPHAGTVSTFAVFTNMAARLGFANPYWHFSCDGPHGLPPSTRAAQVDWMRYCILGADAPKPQGDYRVLDSRAAVAGRPPYQTGRTGTTGVPPVAAASGHTGTTGVPPVADATSAPLPFPAEAQFCTPTHQVRDLPGFRSVYDIIADEALRLAMERKPHAREELRGIVRRRANIRPLAELGEADETNFDHPFKWWYLEGREGKLAENHAAILAMMGRSRVGVKAEAMLRDAAKRVAANCGRPVVLEAKGADCIAAAHAYAAEPQLFSSVRFTDAPPSWTEMATNPDPRLDSFAVAVWGALREYDWSDLTPKEDLK